MKALLRRFQRAEATPGRPPRRAAASRLPVGIGITASVVLIGGSIAFGATWGGHGAQFLATLKEYREAVAITAGFGIKEVAIEGRQQVGERELLELAGATDRASLLFLDVEEARTRLKSNPWIAEAEVRKFYPNRLQVRIEERVPFALWQKDGKISIIAADGTVVAPLTERRFAHLPLVVGRGAGVRAKDFLAVMDRHPDLREQMRAAILVAERRWSLRLKNGLEVRLPEAEMEEALDRLRTFDRDLKLLTRDLSLVDMRLADRLTVRLSDEAFRAREEALKERNKPKRKGGDA